jgi:hypothetical protein
MPGGEKGCDMTDQTMIQINVDTFSDGDGYFVRAEIDAHSVNVTGRFPTRRWRCDGRFWRKARLTTEHEIWMCSLKSTGSTARRLLCELSSPACAIGCVGYRPTRLRDPPGV